MAPAYSPVFDTLRALLNQRILVLDGAMGTMIQRYKLSEAEWRGERLRDHHKDLRGNSDALILTRPDVISAIHHEYLAAGADIIETNTFSSTVIGQGDYALEPLVRELNVEGARLAREAVDEWNRRTPGKPRFVAGSMGPMNRTLSISPDVNNPAFRGMTFDQCRAAYEEEVRGLIDGGADIILLETIFDTLNAKAGIVAIENVFEERGLRRPRMMSLTKTELIGRTHSGQKVARRLLHVDSPRAAVLGRHQLRARRARDAPVPRGAGRPRRLLRQLLPERRPAQCVRRVRRAPRRDQRAAPRVRHQRLRQHRRRLLRHDA